MFRLAAPFFALSLFFVPALAQDTDINTVLQTLKSTCSIPDVLPDFQLRAPIEVSFGSITVQAGMNLSIAQTTNEPTFAVKSANPEVKGKAFTLAIVDPDAPAPPNRTFGQFLHLIQPDLVSSGQDANGLYELQNKSASLVAFFPPAPPAGSPPHRYIAALFQQTSSLIPPPGFPTDFTGDNNVNNRVKFNLTQFAAQSGGGLQLASATMFFVGPDSSSSSGADGNGTGTDAGNAKMSSAAAACTLSPTADSSAKKTKRVHPREFHAR